MNARREQPIVGADDDSISLERMLHARTVVAQVIMLHGPAYLPIFERIELEIEERRRRDALLDRVKQIANGEDD